MQTTIYGEARSEPSGFLKNVIKAGAQEGQVRMVRSCCFPEYPLPLVVRSRAYDGCLSATLFPVLWAGKGSSVPSATIPAFPDGFLPVPTRVCILYPESLVFQIHPSDDS